MHIKPLIPYCEYVSYMHTKTTHSSLWIRFLYAYKNHSFRMVNAFLICIQKPLIRWCEYVSYMHKKPLIPYCEYVSYMHTKTTHSVWWIRFLYAYKNHSFGDVNTFLICIKNHSFRNVNTFLIGIQKPHIP